MWINQDPEFNEERTGKNASAVAAVGAIIVILFGIGYYVIHIINGL